MKQRVTIADVARVAGVSKQTVSRAINDKGEISSETKANILQVIEDLGYRPNRMAQAMNTNQSLMVGLVIPDITNPFFAEVARGVQDAAMTNDYTVLLCNTDENADTEMSILERLASQAVDALIMFSVNSDLEAIYRFADSFQPIVVINLNIDHPNMSAIMVDNDRGAQLAIDHFVAQGHQKIAMLTNKNVALEDVRRVHGYRTSLARHGLSEEPERIVGGAATLIGGYAATVELFEQFPDTSAIFTYNDLMALGAIRYCQELGKQIPEEVAIIGFDDIQLAAMSSPALSSVHIDKHDLGQKAFNHLLGRLQNPKLKPPPFEIGIRLSLRETTRSKL